MTAPRITAAFITRYAPHYPVTALERRLFAVDGKKARKKEKLGYGALARLAEWRSPATARRLEQYADKPARAELKHLTKMALAAETPHRLRMPVLTIIDGVGTPFASAILAVVYPNDFALMDARALGVLHAAGHVPSTSTARVAYADYLQVMRALAAEAQVSLHDVYRALAAYALHGENVPGAEGIESTAPEVEGESVPEAPAGTKASADKEDAAEPRTAPDTDSAQKTAAKKAPAKKTAAKKQTAKKSDAAAKSSAKKTTAKKSGAGKTPAAKKPSSKKSGAGTTTAAKKQTTARTSGTAKTSAKASATAKAEKPASAAAKKKAPATTKAESAKKSAHAKKPAAAKKTPAKKTPAKKTSAKKPAAAKKSSSGSAGRKKTSAAK